MVVTLDANQNVARLLADYWSLTGEFYNLSARVSQRSPAHIDVWMRDDGRVFGDLLLFGCRVPPYITVGPIRTQRSFTMRALKRYSEQVRRRVGEARFRALCP